MYNNPYANIYNTQPSLDRINEQINQLENMKKQMQNNTPAINQTFQLAPTNNHTMRYADTIDDVSKEMVYFDTPFFSKDMSVLWIKNIKGDIKSYELNEIVPKDSKDFEIEYLKNQIEDLKGMIKNDANDANVKNDDGEQVATNTSKYDERTRNEFKSDKSSGIQKVSGSKKKQ